ncbi:unnamed protein product [Chrysodeixis includens]|nr:unnamed protein product [Chrysodeixis includens]
MAGYPYGNPQQYPPPQGQPIYPQLYNPVNAGAPPPGQPGFPPQFQPQYQPGFGYPYQPGQPGQPPSAMSYPSVQPTAPPGPGFGYNPTPGYPNVSPTPAYQSPVEWIPTTPNDAAAYTERAVVAGYEGHDGSPLWVIRARYDGDLIPGKLAIKHRAAYVPWGGKENPVNNIEICCARPQSICWVQSNDGLVPPNAVCGGNTSTGEPLYIGRVKEQRSLTPGKVHPSHKALYISFAGKEIAHKVYEIMCTA